ncbi:SHOCT domain-containing protein [Amnibacterium kyonggiense]|uniref:Putative oligomerization/nucleic acid binding protein n=1 Tax=Amnibacterium kyonggiense TaxID=595671 RepID=A0A4R7FGX7_9MICO|nr:SHOCT domain-containing protein [Amnibacterium kyonggiense]TDS74870.1 putative oligomerization/nucleic acid binding protein [Amnibacterium kyonggiense]
MVSVQRHLAVLRSALQPGETERLWIRAERSERSHAGALLLTDRRLLFSGLGFVSQSQEAWPLTIVSGVRVTPAGLELQVLGAPEAFIGKPKDLERFAALLPTTAATDASVADELERLVRLRDSGALSPAEFEGAKRRLLE